MEADIPTQFDLIRSRLEDFFGQRVPWHRRLWSIGTILGLREVLEYSNSCLSGEVPSTEGLRYVVATSRREVARDPGVDHLAKELDQVLALLSVSSSQKIPRATHDELEQLIRRADNDYFSRWEHAQTIVAVEFSARAIASHLLDSGFSDDHLFRWLKAKRSSISSVQELAKELAIMTNEMQFREHTVFVPCSAPFDKSNVTSGDTIWMDGGTAANWLKQEIPEKETRRHNGGFLFVVKRRDPWSAIEAARSLVARADARAKVARPSNEGIRLDGWARVAGSKQTFDVRYSPHRVEIGSLYRQNSIYSFDNGLPAETDDALELASYMESPSPGAAVTGGWAAVEALLTRPGEGKHHLAADRLASLVACSLPRAELTSLAYRHMENGSDQLASDIGNAETNYDKVKLVESHLKSGEALALSSFADVAAQMRIVAIINDPSEHLSRVRSYLTESLRRLYNQRNIIAHSGSLRSVALAATVRTSFGLVGAGLDRIIHAQLVESDDLSPLALVARAETELRLVGLSGGRSPTSLLD